MKLAGVEGLKRHWRHLIARYRAYPTVWIIGGESGGPQWTEVARYVQKIDPYRHPSTIHPFQSGRLSVTDKTVIDFDMLQTGHGDWDAARGAIPQVRAAYARKPPMPVVIGEYCYEGHMQTAFQDVQRYVFWGNTLSGSAERPVFRRVLVRVLAERLAETSLGHQPRSLGDSGQPVCVHAQSGRFHQGRL